MSLYPYVVVYFTRLTQNSGRFLNAYYNEIYDALKEPTQENFNGIVMLINAQLNNRGSGLRRNKSDKRKSQDPAAAITADIFKVDQVYPLGGFGRWWLWGCR